MANIPVRRRGVLPWWAWLLIALVAIAALAWLFIALFGGREGGGVAGTTGTTTTTPAAGQPPSPSPQAASPVTKAQASPSPAGPITDLTVILNEPNKLSLAGRPIQLSNVRVQDVVGDKTFWVGPSDTQRLFVFLEEDPGAGKKVDGKVYVNPWQTVALTGEIRRLPSAGEAQQQLEMSPQEFEAASRDQIYLFARSAEVVSR